MCMVAPDRRKKEVGTIAAQEPRLNEAIKVKECRLIAYDGSQLGIFPIEQAQRIADNEGYDLVEIAPQAQPPVCRIMDYGKFKYDQAIKAKHKTALLNDKIQQGVFLLLFIYFCAT